ncbi:MAG: PQQ-binding-like beta-propeller repeat protein [Planctomycetaceae bacterium]|nr:PQQ-binding-like beta-propeller repeat protein [Planctomycetaceae bacterium]
MSNTFQTPAREELSVLDLMYVGFNSRVVALDRDTGEIVWDWKSPKGSGFVATLLDKDHVIASVQGYMYCLDALTGEELWSNPLTGMGLGVPSLTSIYGISGSAAAAMLIAQQQQQQQQTASA